MGEQTLLAALLACGMLAGAGGCRPAAPTTPLPRPAANAPAPAVPTGGDRLTAASAGPVRLGMAQEEVARLAGFQASPTHIQLEGESYPALLLTRRGQPAALAELQEDKVWRIRVLDASLKTAEGAGLGTTASRLQKLYGPGRLAVGEGNTCATFAKAPGLSFCFAPGTGPPVKSWADVVKHGLSVTTILVVGESD